MARATREEGGRGEPPVILLTNRRDDGHQLPRCGEHVGGIRLSTQPCFHDRHIHLGAEYLL